MRFRVRTLMIAVAVVATLMTMTNWVGRCLRVRAEARTQVVALRLRLLDADIALELCEATLRFDPGDQAPVARGGDAERRAWIRRGRENYRTLLARWQRSADRPWERKPADLPRID